jgi:hypothetical protein
MATKSPERSKKIVWFARGGGIAKCGPFKTQLEAVNAMRLVKRKARTRIACNVLHGKADVALVHEPEQRVEFPADVFVWPEERQFGARKTKE